MKSGPTDTVQLVWLPSPPIYGRDSAVVTFLLDESLSHTFQPYGEDQRHTGNELKD